MSVQSSDFTAGYYLACTALGGLIVGSIVHQTLQIRTYISRTEWPNTEDLTNRRGKYDRSDVNRRIHFALTVWLHKFWNYGLHIIGIGDKTVSEILCLFLYIGVNIIFLALPFPNVNLPTQLNYRCAYIALANAAFVFPLATRNSIFVTLIGVPFERIITLHRWVGRTIFLLLTFHGTYQIQSLYPAYGNSLYTLLSTYDVSKWGFLAYVFLVIIVITSHSLFRRFAFEFFYWSHFNFLFFVIFGCLHQYDFFRFTIIGICLYGIDRLVRFLVGLKKIDVISMEAISSGVTRIIFNYPTYYEAGQYMFVNIPQLRLPVSLLAWHPFSYSSAPSAKDKGVHYASIHVKTQGGFTKALYAKSQKNGQQSMKLRIDGPYGKPLLDFKAHRTVLLVAGGIGVTPMISILRDLVGRQITSMPIVTQEIHFMWIIPDQVSYSWFADEIQEIITQSSALPEDKYLLDIKTFFTKATTTPSSQFFAGRPDFKSVFNDIKQYHGSGDIAVGVCGPAVMLKEVRNAAVSESDESCLFKVHTETFEL